MRQLVLDTETTGLELSEGHRIIEIGCVELVNRRPTGNNFHQYLDPQREIDEAATQVHGIGMERLAEKPRFADVVDDLLGYLSGAELIIHNAAFDVGFLDHELALVGREPIGSVCTVLDTLTVARRMHPGQRNSLDALCRRYQIDHSRRRLHGALLDAEILAEVYLAMTGGQTSLLLETAPPGAIVRSPAGVPAANQGRPALRVRRADAAELDAHRNRLQAVARACGGQNLWDRLEEGSD